MAITSIGYDGSVNEAQWAKLLPVAGASHYGIVESNDWKVTAHATLDRGVKVAIGSGWGHGVLDTSTTTINLQGGAVGTGSRWDLVVARRDWAGTGGVTSFVIIPGTPTKAIPNRNTVPGSLDDQPLALVQFTAGSTAPTAIVDLRCWARNGGMTARDELALTYLRELGATVTINGTDWSCDLDRNGQPIWSAAHVAGFIPLFGSGNPIFGALANTTTQFLVQAGSQMQTSDGAGYGRITFPNPFPNGLLTVMGFDGDDWTGGGSIIYGSGGNRSFHGDSAYGDRTSWVYAVKTQPASANATGSTIIVRTPNKLHRINWIAIGW